MATISYLLRGTKDRKKIYVSLSLKKGVVFQRSTKWSIDKNQWNNKTNRPKPYSGVNRNLKKDLDTLQDKLYRALDNSTNVNGVWLSEQIKIALGEKTTKGRSNLIVDNIQYIIDEAPFRENVHKKTGLSESRINSYKGLKNTIQDLRPNAIVKDVNPQFVKLLIKDMNHYYNYSHNHSIKKMQDLKTVCREAEINGIEVSPNLKHIKLTKLPNKYTLTFSDAELKSIVECTTLTEAEDNARKWLLLGCKIGQRVNDLLAIKDKNFVTKEGRTFLVLTQDKTGKKVEIPILKTTKEIIGEKLPYRISDVKLNIHIKEVCRKAGLTKMIKGKMKIDGRMTEGTYPKYKLVSSHIFRRTFATHWYGKVNTAWIKEVTGHSTEQNLLIYIGKQPDKIIQMYDAFDTYDNH